MIQQPELFVNILIVLGEGFWVFSSYSQLRKLIKTHNTKGLSTITTTLNAAGNIAWCVYFSVNHLWFPFATNIALLILSIGILGYLLLDRTRLLNGILAIIGIGIVTSCVMFFAQTHIGWLGMIYNWIAATPWLIKVISTKKVSGISGKALIFAIGAMTLTMSYGLIIQSTPLVVGCIQGLLYTLIITRYYLHYHQRK